jgi:LysR family transcriptional regulator (chromosome initiation inhibitor)
VLDRDQLETFATIVELQSFERAAGALRITRGAVSQRIKALEQSLAAVLLVRDKPVVPTPAGETLLRHVQAVRMLEGSTLRALGPAAGAGEPVPMAVSVNADSLATWFRAVLWALLRERGVALEVIVDDLDHTAARLARGQVVGCVSSEPTPASGFAAQPLGEMEYRCYASPGFAREFFADGLALPAVLALPTVLFDRKDSLHDRYLASCFGFAVDRYPRHYLPSPDALIEAIEQGAGYGLLPSRQAAARVADGVLVELAPHRAVPVALYWHHWEFEPPLCKALTALVMACARA